MQAAVSSEQSTQSNFMQVGNIAAFATPSTASITTIPGQKSILDLSITIQNTSTNAPIEIKAIAIQLPVTSGSEATNLTSIGALAAIVPSAKDSIWDLSAGSVSGQFLATPKTGVSNTLAPNQSAIFNLDNIELNTTVGIATIDIKIKDASDTITDLSTTVTKEKATAAITQFDAQPSDILPNGTSSLQWKTNQIDYCLISPINNDPKNPLKANGNLNVQPKETTLYTLLAYATGILLSSQAGVTVKKPGIINFGKTENGPIKYGENVNLHWETNTYTTSVALVAIPTIDTIPAKLPTNGTVSIGPLTKNTIFTLTAYDAHKNQSVSVPVAVEVTDPLPIITSFSVFWKGSQLMATWETKNATQVLLDPIPTPLNPNGTISVYPTYPLQYSYTLVAKNDSGDTVTKIVANTYDNLRQHPNSPVSLPGASAVSIATSTNNETIYVANSANNSFYILDAETLTQVPNSPVDIGNAQRSVVVSDKDNRIFAATNGVNGLKVLDPTTLKQIAGSPVAIGGTFTGIVTISPDFKRIYTGNTDPGVFTILDYETLLPVKGSPMKISTGAIVLSSDSTRIFVVGAGSLSIFNAETLLPIPQSPIPLAGFGFSMTISPDGNRLYIINSNEGTLTIINTQTFQKTPESPIAVGNRPTSIALSPDSQFIFIGHSIGGTVTILNAQTLKPTMASPISIVNPTDVAISKNGIVYVSSSSSGVSVFLSDYTEVVE